MGVRVRHESVCEQASLSLVVSLSHALSWSLVVSLFLILVVSLTHTLSLSPPLTRTSHDGPL